LMIIAIPIHILWRVKIRFQQKLLLGSSLCLSVVMCVVALVRASGLTLGDFMDETWAVFWQQIEACVAVMLVSITTFRSFFVSTESRVSPRKRSPTNGQVSRKPVVYWTKRAGITLPSIPSATLTGLRTFIRRDPEHRTSDSLLDDTVTSSLTQDGAIQTFTGSEKVCLARLLKVACTFSNAISIHEQNVMYDTYDKPGAKLVPPSSSVNSVLNRATRKEANQATRRIGINYTNSLLTLYTFKIRGFWCFSRHSVLQRKLVLRSARAVARAIFRSG
ncbi:MAG: hypothetical protein Q9184_006660, partial [Pyrenodesmia sp. 2 TL-2023]